MKFWMDKSINEGMLINEKSDYQTKCNQTKVIMALTEESGNLLRLTRLRTVLVLPAWCRQNGWKFRSFVGCDVCGMRRLDSRRPRSAPYSTNLEFAFTRCHHKRNSWQRRKNQIRNLYQKKKLRGRKSKNVKEPNLNNKRSKTFKSLILVLWLGELR